MRFGKVLSDVQKIEKFLNVIIPEFPSVRAGIFIVSVTKGIAGKRRKIIAGHVRNVQKEILIAASMVDSWGR